MRRASRLLPRLLAASEACLAVRQGEGALARLAAAAVQQPGSAAGGLRGFRAAAVCQSSLADALR